jgi:hypothetical protein
MVVALTGLALLVSACSHAAGTPHSSGSTTSPGAHRSTTTTTVPTTAAPTTSTTSTTSTSAASSIGTLTTRSQPAGNYAVSLPAAWVFTDTSVPSDHQTNIWSDPSDPSTSLTVLLSGCEGCVKTSLTSSAPDPTNVLPAGATVTQTVAPWQVFYTKAATPSGYEDFGMIDVTHNGTAVTGYVMLDLVLPASDATSANAVLASFTLSQ